MNMYVGIPSKHDIEYDQLVYILLFVNGFSIDSYNFSLYESNLNFILGQYNNFLIKKRISLTTTMNDKLRQNFNKKRDSQSLKTKQLIDTFGSTKTIISSLIIRNHPAIKKEVSLIRKKIDLKKFWDIETWEQYEQALHGINVKLLEDEIKAFFSRFPSLHKGIWETPVKILILSNKLPIPHVPRTIKIEIDSPVMPAKNLREIADVMRRKFQQEENNKYPRLIIKSTMTLTELASNISNMAKELEVEMKKIRDFSDYIPEPEDFLLFLMQHFIWQLRIEDKYSYTRILDEIDNSIIKNPLIKRLTNDTSLKILNNYIHPIIDTEKGLDQKDSRDKLREHVTNMNRYFYKKISAVNSV